MIEGITIIYPALFNELSEPWDAEYQIAENVGFNVYKFEEDTLAIKKDLSNQLIIYRGWMISLEDYKKLSENVESKGGIMFIPVEQFKKANSFSNWYNILQRYTMDSYFIKDFDELDKYFKDGEAFFVKDDLKSLGSKQSIAYSKDEAISIYNKIQENRDFILENNGICLREIIELDNEERFFAIDGKIIGIHTDNDRLSLAEKVAKDIYKRLGLMAISIDIAHSNIKNVLVEVGGFQVSDMDKDGDLVKIEEFYTDLLQSVKEIVGL